MKESLADQLGGMFGKKRFDGSETRVFDAATAENVRPGAILANNLTSEDGLVLRGGLTINPRHGQLSKLQHNLPRQEVNKNLDKGQKQDYTRMVK